MSRIFHVWWIVIIAVIVLALIIVWGLFSTSQTLSANNLYDAVNDSAQYAMDNSSRMDRGTFVINREAFEKRLSEYKIKNYGKASNNGSKPSKLYIHYLVDNPNTNSTNSDYSAVKDGYINPKGYARSDVGSQHPGDENDNTGYTANSKSKYLPIRAIQVQANADGHKTNDPNGVSDTKDKYVATDVVQTQDTDKDIDQALKATHQKTDNKANAKDQLNNPIRNANNTHRNTADLTDNTYNNENGYAKTINSTSNDD